MKNSIVQPFVVYDVETGGLDYLRHPIVEIAMVPVVFSLKQKKFIIKEELSFSCIVKPYSKDLFIEKKALEINKIPMEKILEGKSVVGVLKRITKLVEAIVPEGKDKYDKKFLPILAGHNIDAFDNDFLKKFLKCAGTSIGKLFSVRTFDTYTQSIIAFAGNSMIESLSLQNICNFVGIKFESEAHRALADSMANAKLVVKYANLISAERNRKDLLSL
jgi:DNA polymerase III epsilon subunit-like protein